MTYKGYLFLLSLRVLGLFGSLLVLAFGVSWKNTYAIGLGTVFSVIAVYSLYKFVIRRFVEMDDFFESVKYRDFSRWFVEEKGPQDIRKLHAGFNLVNRTIKEINSERQAQFVYLQKILEMVEVGIIAYNLTSGEVLWANDSILKTLDFPSFKNIHFVKKRRPKVYAELFDTYHAPTDPITLKMRQESIEVLISDTVFRVEKESFKLIVLQNIEDTLNRTESEAWKKLLSVMTHEIMNSIAPISSLAETLQTNIVMVQNDPNDNSLDLNDLNDGISSIKKRSEGLMKFAKTYRSLNKITQISREKITTEELFKDIGDLMKPTLAQEKVNLTFEQEIPNLFLEIDTYLIEQVLINLIKNAIEACDDQLDAQITVSAGRTNKGSLQIKVLDNGKGIPQEVMENIFVPFFSTKKTGSGIGLSLSKQIMTLHSGKIQVESRVGEGTLIRLTF